MPTRFILNEDRMVIGGRYFAGVNIPFTFNGRAFLWSWDDYIYIDSKDEQAKKNGRYKVKYEEFDYNGLCTQLLSMIDSITD